LGFTQKFSHRRNWSLLLRSVQPQQYLAVAMRG
jgi:hypothetical protein